MRSPYTRTPIFRTRRRCVLQLVISCAAAAAAAVDVAVAVTAAAATAAAAAAAAATATYFPIKLLSCLVCAVERQHRCNRARGGHIRHKSPACNEGAF